MKCQNCGKVDHDEDAIFCESCGAKLINGNSSATLNETDMEMLNIIRVASQKDNVLAALNARRECYKICKKETQRNDYRAYVEALQLDYFPKEFKKAEYGQTYEMYLSFLIVSMMVFIMGVILLPVSAIFDDGVATLASVFMMLFSSGGVIISENKKNKIAKCIKELK